MKKQQVYS